MAKIRAGFKTLFKRVFYGIHIRFFIWCTLLSSTLLIVISLLAAQRTADDKRADIDRQMDALAGFMAATLDNYFEDLRATLITVAINPDLRRILDGRFTDDIQKYNTYSTYNRLVGSIIATRQYNQLYLVMPGRGQILSTDVKHSTDRFDAAGAGWLRRLEAGQGGFVLLQGFDPGGEPGDLAFTLAFRMGAAGQAAADYLLVSVERGWFEDSMGGVVDGAILACSVTGGGGAELFRTGGGVGESDVVQYSRASSVSGCTVTLWYDTASIEQAQRNETRAVMLGLAASILLAFVVSYTISWKLNRPIRQLKNAMERMERDDYSARIGQYSNDEIGEIGHSFDRMADRIRVLIGEVYAGELLWRETELMALQQQINPHFLYNTLEVINTLANRGDGPAIRDVVQKLSSLFRYSVSTGRDQDVLLADEIRHAQDYVDIQRIRLGGRLKAGFTMLGGLDRCVTLKFVLQPVIENCMHHGFAGMKEQGVVETVAWRDGDDVHITVTDNGRGLDDEALEGLQKQLQEQSARATRSREALKQQSSTVKIGLTNVNARLKLRYGDAFGLTVSHAPGRGLRVEIVFPVQRMEVAG